jgi:N-acetylglucosamine-6-sulfatase
MTLGAVAAERPNIVFLFSDDHALNAISAYGGPLKEIAPTPNIDRLSKEGAIFTRSYCSNSICGPSRAAVLTGKHSAINGFVDNDECVFDGSQTTFPKLLQKAGYQTSVIGKWHLVSAPTGFDHWEILPGQGNYYNPDFITAAGNKREQGYCTDLITDKAISWLETGRDKSKPFVLMCQQKAPHRNWAPAPRHYSLFKDVTIPEPVTLFDDYAGRSATLRGQQMTIAKDFHWGHDMKFHGETPFPGHFLGGIPNGEYARMTDGQKKAWDAAYEPENQAFISSMKANQLSSDDVTRWKYQRYLKDYLRCIRAVDENVGHLLDYLQKSGLAENTIVIYSSDQGFYLGEHGWYDKRWMFEESLSMPFLIRWPGVVEPGSRNASLIQNIDYAPTFLEMAGAPVPKEMQGRSLVPVLKAGSETPSGWRDAIYYFYSGESTHAVAAHDGIRTDKLKLMWFPETKEWNLFDLEKDPREMKSVHADPGYAAILEGMKKRYEELKAGYRVNEATTPAHKLKEPWWKERHSNTVKLAREGGHDLVFIGDSITQGWEERGKPVWDEFYGNRKALNLGFSADRTEHVLWRLLNGELDKVDPKAFVLMIGTNNTGQRSDDPAKTASGVRCILDLLRDRRPDAKIVLLSVFPRQAAADGELRKMNDDLNQQIAGFADGETIIHLDVNASFLEKDGRLTKEIMPDFLHPGIEGYRRWAEALEPTLIKLGFPKHEPAPAIRQ